MAIAFLVFFRGYVEDWSIVATMILFPSLIVIGYFSKFINCIGGLRVSKYLGKISFDIYLWNCPILVIMAIMHDQFGFAMNSRRFICLLIVVHIIIGYISDRIMGEIIMRWARSSNNRKQ